MSDDGAAPRHWWWPQSVRVRLTIIATLAFAITITAAAFGMVRLVRTNLVDRIEETTTVNALRVFTRMAPPS